jgi:small subunit ribosomal protein S5e
MSDNGEVEVENPSGYYSVLPKDVQTDSVKLFGKWSYVSYPGKLCW